MFSISLLGMEDSRIVKSMLSFIQNHLVSQTGLIELKRYSASAICYNGGGKTHLLKIRVRGNAKILSTAYYSG